MDQRKRLVKGRFSWQAGYGAFSYTKSQVPNVINYIKNQEEHHRTKSFTEEYIEFLKEFSIEYDERNIFKPILVKSRNQTITSYRLVRDALYDLTNLTSVCRT